MRGTAAPAVRAVPVAGAERGAAGRGGWLVWGFDPLRPRTGARSEAALRGGPVHNGGSGLWSEQVVL